MTTMRMLMLILSLVLSACGTDRPDDAVTTIASGKHGSPLRVEYRVAKASPGDTVILELQLLAKGELGPARLHLASTTPELLMLETGVTADISIATPGEAAYPLQRIKLLALAEGRGYLQISIEAGINGRPFRRPLRVPVQIGSDRSERLGAPARGEPDAGSLPAILD